MLHKKRSASRQESSQRSVSNSAKTLLANIRFMRVDEPVRTVLITSAIPNEGKTFVAVNLARAMATSGVRTLVVECDMRRRSMAHALHAHAQHGLYAALAGDVSLAEAVVQTDTPRLSFLDAEPHIPNPSDLLNSRRFTNLIEEAKKIYGYIVFDTPPVCTFVDAAVLGARVDAVLMVVREQHTRKDEVRRAAEQLKTANVQLSGVVMNFCSRHSSEYYYYYDYYYQESDAHADRHRAVAASIPPVDMPTDPAGTDTGSLGNASHLLRPASWDNAPDTLDENAGEKLMRVTSNPYLQ